MDGAQIKEKYTLRTPQEPGLLKRWYYCVKKYHLRPHLTNYTFFNDEVTYLFDLEKPIDDFLDFSEVFSTVSHRMLDKVSSIQLDKKHSAVGE